VDVAQRQLSERIDDATQRLLGTARVLTDPDLREPSMLPGWSRGYVLAHLARGADAMRNLLVGVSTGEDRRGYASSESRAADIEHGSRRSAKDLAADMAVVAYARVRISCCPAGVGPKSMRRSLRATCAGQLQEGLFA
jgi:maleylpyruvate isomerase